MNWLYFGQHNTFWILIQIEESIFYRTWNMIWLVFCVFNSSMGMGDHPWSIPFKFNSSLFPLISIWEGEWWITDQRQIEVMKIQCDVCNKHQASVFCTADEAALCDACDHRVYHANKLASKHQRFSLNHPSQKHFPLCDICQVSNQFSITCILYLLNYTNTNQGLHISFHLTILIDWLKVNDFVGRKGLCFLSAR